MKRQAVLAALFALLLMPAVAGAVECAWVLWHYQEFAGIGEEWKKWNVVQAFKTLPVCEEMFTIKRDDMHNDHKDWKSDSPGIRSLKNTPEGVFFNLKEPPGFVHIGFKCLPDTVDPRGKKE